MSAFSGRDLSAEIVVLREGDWDETSRTKNLETMIIKKLKEETRQSVTVTFSSIPSKFLFSSNAVKMRATIGGAYGVMCVEKLMELFGEHGLKVSVEQVVSCNRL